MRTLSIRIPDELDERLERESKRARRKRSELVREAVGRYLEELERQRFMDRMVRAASALKGDPEIRAVAEEFAESEAEALRFADARMLEVAEPEPPPYGESDEPEPGDES